MLPGQLLYWGTSLLVGGGVVTFAGFKLFTTTHTPAPEPIITMTPSTATQSTQVLTQLSKICYIHHRMYAAAAASEPQTFFDYLGLDTAHPPFDGMSWMDAEGDSFGRARYLINVQYHRRKQRLMDHGGGTREGILARVVGALEEAETARTYVNLVMPKIQGVRGEKRLTVLKELCGELWK